MWLKAERQSVFLPTHFSALAAFQGKVMSRHSPSTVWSRASVHPALLLLSLLLFPHFHRMPPFLFSGSSPEWFYATCCVPCTYNVGRLFGRRDHFLNCHKMCMSFFCSSSLDYRKSDNEDHRRCHRSGRCWCDSDAHSNVISLTKWDHAEMCRQLWTRLCIKEPEPQPKC